MNNITRYPISQYYYDPSDPNDTRLALESLREVILGKEIAEPFWETSLPFLREELKEETLENMKRLFPNNKYRIVEKRERKEGDALYNWGRN